MNLCFVQIYKIQIENILYCFLLQKQSQGIINDTYNQDFDLDAFWQNCYLIIVA